MEGLPLASEPGNGGDDVGLEFHQHFGKAGGLLGILKSPTQRFPNFLFIGARLLAFFLGFIEGVGDFSLIWGVELDE